MKVLIYVNGAKEISEKVLKTLITSLKKKKIEYNVSYAINPLNENDLNDVAVVFAVGGDGTILGLTELLSKKSLPVVSINTGKIGFLTEFESTCAKQSVDLFLSDVLEKDSRAVLKVNFNGKDYFALNELVVQRVYNANENGIIINVEAKIDGEKVDVISGDGVIISTPTGSTAYSLSAGGPVLAPGINAFALTPISAHSLHNRPIIFSSSSFAEINLVSGSAGIFIDGKFVSTIKSGQIVKVERAEKDMVFLRNKNSNFYKRLIKKLNRTI